MYRAVLAESKKQVADTGKEWANQRGSKMIADILMGELYGKLAALG